MPSLNQIIIMGHVGRAPELKGDGGKERARFSVATTRRFKRGDTWEEDTQWHSVVTWGQSAIRAVDSVAVGDLVIVQGSMRYYEHQGKNYAEIQAQTFTVLSKKQPKPQESRDDEPPF